MTPTTAARPPETEPITLPYPHMSLFPDLPLSSSPPAKPKITSQERRARQEDRLTTIRLRMAIWRKLDERGVTTPADIGLALGMPAAEAIRLLTRHQWRDGDVAKLKAVAARLEAQVAEPLQLFGAKRMEPGS
jgi:hypothetical protein